MPAEPDRIGFILGPYRSVVVEDADAAADYGDDARDTKDEPVETWFDSLADAEAIGVERIGLIGVGKRRFRTVMAGIQTPAGTLDYSQTLPAINLIDTEKSADVDGVAVEFGWDFAKKQTTIVTWGG